MYEKTAGFIVSYIQSIIENFPVADATTDFKEPKNYASFYINIVPVTPHETLVNQEEIDPDTKAFTYKQSSYLNIRIDFRGDDCHSNMALFKNSFLKDNNREFLKEAGFGFFGISQIIPLTTLRDSKSKKGTTTTLKLLGSELIVDECQIIKIKEFIVSNKLT